MVHQSCILCAHRLKLSNNLNTFYTSSFEKEFPIVFPIVLELKNILYLVKFGHYGFG